MSMSLAIVCQVLIALGIFNVWVVRRNRPTAFRPDGAADIEDEFRRYGFPNWMWKVVGTAKVTLAALLLVGIVFPAVAQLAALGMALLMVGAIAAHVRVSDPLVKSVPALTMLLLSVAVIASYSA